MSRLNLFRQLLKKESPEMDDKKLLEFSSIQTEIDTLTTVLEDYGTKMSEGIRHMCEIREHIAILQQQQVQLISEVKTVNPNGVRQ